MTQNLVSTGAAWLAGQMKAHAARTITYRRSPDEVDLVATPGHTIYELATRYSDAAIKIVRHDELFDAADLILGGSLTEPERGDRISVTEQGAKVEYEIMGPGGDEPDWQYVPGNQSRIRIHCKEVSRA